MTADLGSHLVSVPDFQPARPRRPWSGLVATLVVALFLVSGCGTDPDDTSTSTGSSDSSGESGGDDYPDVTEVEISASGDGYDLDVTMTSPYDSPERYADGWRVLDADGNELGTMTLSHDHASEQPFTRAQVGLEIPDDVTEVTVEGHDQANGYGGKTVTVVVP